jgi:hypothetical protein
VGSAQGANAGSSTQQLSLAGRTLGVDTGVQSGAVTLSNSQSANNPDSWLQADCEINRNGVVSMLLIDPRGDMAAWTFPEGPGNFGRTAVQHPMAGTWTGVISSPIGTSNPARSRWHPG